MAAGESESGAPLQFIAFISYRHVDPDRWWARWLHSAMETYRAPARLRKQHKLPTRLGRVFRDEEELSASSNLSAELEEALRQSRFLIVICSPRTPQSRWVNEEVKRFREWGRHDRILALLIEGEPRDSFPAALTEIRRSLTDAQGLTRDEIESVEPLAADVRPHEGGSGTRTLRRLARLRLLAQVLGVRFDDLRQRDQERRVRQLTWLGAAATALAVAMGGLTVFALHQRNLAEMGRQNAEQRRLESERRLAEGDVLRGDALAAARQWAGARAAYNEAREVFADLRTSDLTAELGLTDTYAQSPPPLLTWAAAPGAPLAVSLTPDGMLAESVGADGSVWTCDPLTGIPVLVFHTSLPPACAAFSPDASDLLIASTPAGHAGLLLALFDARTGREIRRFGMQDEPGDKSPADARPSLSFSKDGSRVVLVRGGGAAVEAWDIERGVRLSRWHGPDLASAATFSPDGKTVAAGGFMGMEKDKGVMLFGVGAGEPLPGGGQNPAPLRSFVGHWMGTLALAFSPDGEFLATGGNDMPVRLWDLTGRQVRQFEGHHDIVLALAFSPDGRQLASSSRDGTVRIWDVGLGRQLRSVDTPGGAATPICFSSDGRMLLVGGLDGVLRLCDVTDCPEARFFDDADGGCEHDADFSPDGRLAVTCGWLQDSQLIRVWDVETGRRLKNLRGHSGAVNSTVFSPDGHSILSGGFDKTAKLWDLASGKVTRTFIGHQGSVERVAFAPRGDCIATGGTDNIVRLWPADRGAPAGDAPPPAATLTLSGHTAPITSLAFSPDASRLLSASLDGTARIYELPGGRVVQVLKSPPGKAVSVAIFTPDGRSVLTGGDTAAVTLWDLQSGRATHEIPGHHGFIPGICLLGQGELGKLPMCLSAGVDLTLRVWDLGADREVRAWVEGDDPTIQMHGCAATHDGRRVISVMDYRTPRLRDFTRPARYRDFQIRLPAALEALRRDPKDAQGLETLGEWYAFRGIWHWATRCLGEARARGAKVSPLLLGRCDWQAGHLSSAQQEFAAAGGEAPPGYLDLCRQGIEAEESRPRRPATPEPGHGAGEAPEPPDTQPFPGLGPPILLPSK